MVGTAVLRHDSKHSNVSVDCVVLCCVVLNYKLCDASFSVISINSMYLICMVLCFFFPLTYCALIDEDVAVETENGADVGRYNIGWVGYKD